LNTDKFSENVHFHLRVTADDDTAQQSIARPFARSFSRSRAASRTAFASSAVSLVLRLQDRRARPRNFSEARSSIMSVSAIREPPLVARSGISPDTAPFQIVCFHWYLRDTKVSGQFPIRGGV
jgi:hypothetical protein